MFSRNSYKECVCLQKHIPGVRTFSEKVLAFMSKANLFILHYSQDEIGAQWEDEMNWETGVDMLHCQV